LIKKPELLAPAGDLEKLKVAFAYGADAVYMAGKQLGMRAKAKNFDLSEMQEAVRYAHALGKKIYITANVFAHNQDLDGAAEYFKQLEAMHVDALIVSDLGLFQIACDAVPNMPIHISTQQNTTNYASAAFWHKLGASRVVLARELSLTEITQIHQKSPQVELESFIHGSMCMAYSGRCFISNYLTDRDANRGACSQPCRFNYELVERKSGLSLPVYEDEQGGYIFNSRDLNMVAHIPELIRAGISSFKIEGRMKTAYYVAVTTKIYREALDDYMVSPDLYDSKLSHYRQELEGVNHRGYTTGFYLGPMSGADHAYDGDPRAITQDFLAMVLDYDAENGYATIEQRNKFMVGDVVEVVQTRGANVICTVTELLDEKNNPVDAAPHPKQILKFKTEHMLEPLNIIRKKIFLPNSNLL